MRSLFFLTCRLFSTFSFDSSGFGTDYLSLTLPVFDLHVVLYLQKRPQPIPDLQVLPDSTERVSRDSETVYLNCAATSSYTYYRQEMGHMKNVKHRSNKVFLKMVSVTHLMYLSVSDH